MNGVVDFGSNTNEMLDFEIKHSALNCWICHLPPEPQGGNLNIYMCDAGHVICGSCRPAHTESCAASSSRCPLLEKIVSRVEIKCACGGYFRPSKLVDHRPLCAKRRFCACSNLSGSHVHAWRKCRVKKRFVLCSLCGAKVQTPVFWPGFSDRLVCGECHKADHNKYRDLPRCRGMEYFLKNMIVKTEEAFFASPGEHETKKSLAGNNTAIGEHKGKAPSKEMNKVMDFMINREVLECRICHMCSPQHVPLYLCDNGHVFCNYCKPAHAKSCGGSSSSGRCCSLENMASRLEIKCACGGYFQWSKIANHKYDCPLAKCTPHVWEKCRLKVRFVLCSVCGIILQTPIFKGGSYDRLICGNCHKADTNKNGLPHCPDIEYLIKRMMVKTLRPFFHESCLDEDETKKSVVGNNNITGETKGKAPSKDGETDKIVDSDEDMSEDDSESDDYSRETEEESVKLDKGKRVAETALEVPKTAAAASTTNKKAKIAMKSGKKTGPETCARELRPRRR